MTIDLAQPPALEGVEHRYVLTPGGVSIHVAEAGPPAGPPIMLVHGFPQHWWQWHRLIGPLAADGYRVLVPDMRGAGWSSAPRGPYRKADMAEDLLVVLDRLGVDQVKLAAHDWGGPVAFILLLNHPERVSGFAGFNTIAPWLKVDGPMLAHSLIFYYQYPLLLPGIGPRVIADPRHRYLRWVARWVGGGYEWPEADAERYLSRMVDPERAYAGSQWYRTFQAREVGRWMSGQYADARIHVPVRWITGLKDPVITPTMHRGYESRADDQTFEHVPDVGHWIVEQAHDLALDRLRGLMKA
ncbi:MAG TPA: alpha/beta hydrolase [Solirubrobacteraceae bacterium]|nr:alpha/beta hydrolase [Solirubrobacteraceae bacterium]